MEYFWMENLLWDNLWDLFDGKPDGHSDEILISSTVSGLWIYLKIGVIGYPQIHGES